MGEIADMMLNGIMCCQCGAALYEDVMDQQIGFPIICDDCYAKLSDQEKENYEGRKESDYKKKGKV